MGKKQPKKAETPVNAGIDSEVMLTEKQIEGLNTTFGYGDGDVMKLSSVPKNKRKETKDFLDLAVSNAWVEKSGPDYVLLVDLDNVKMLSDISDQYLDHNGVLRTMTNIFKGGKGGSAIFIGDAGTGKTQCVITLAKELEKLGLTNGMITVNGSEGTKERDLIGMLRVKPSGEFVHVAAGLTQAMIEGKIFYLDEANTIPPGVLVKVDQGLDKRQEVTIQFEGDKTKTIRPEPGFFVFSTVNPLTVVGTRTMPPQIFSRYAYVYNFEYPASPEEEVKIVMANTQMNDYLDDLLLGVKAIQELRNPDTELPYRPTIRESIALHKLLSIGLSLQEAMDVAVINRGHHWSSKVVDQMKHICRLYIK